MKCKPLNKQRTGHEVHRENSHAVIFVYLWLVSVCGRPIVEPAILVSGQLSLGPLYKVHCDLKIYCAHLSQNCSLVDEPLHLHRVWLVSVEYVMCCRCRARASVELRYSIPPPLSSTSTAQTAASIRSTALSLANSWRSMKGLLICSTCV